MQAELQIEHPDIHILGINMIGAEGGMGEVSLISTLPVVNDDTVVHVWQDWGAVWRDVIILNRANEPIYTYNLTTYNLADPTNYATLKQMFIDAATQ
jgi:hypothetical protein